MSPQLESHQQRGWHKAALAGIGIFLLSRVFVIGWAHLAPQDRTQVNIPWWSPNPLVRWDSGHYGGICNQGYPREINDTAAFFPAYPLLCRAARCFANTDDAQVITANICAIAAAVIFSIWATDLRGPAVAWRAVALLSAFPSAYFLSAGYAEGLFVACVAAALLAIQRGNFWVAALASGVATATRPPGIALAAVVVASAFCAMRSRRDKAARDAEAFDCPTAIQSVSMARLAAIALISISGLLIHAAYLAWHYDRWDAYFAAQRTWTPVEIRRPWLKILTLHPLLLDAFAPVAVLSSGQPAKFLEHGTWDGFLGLVILAVGARGLLAKDWGIPRVWFLLPVVTFLLAYLPDPAAGTRLYGISRYQLAALPCFLRVADWDIWRKRPWLFLLLGGALFVLQLANVAAFVNWQEAG